MDNKILIVDDAAFMRMMIKNGLTQNGYTNLVEASDGQMAIDLYKSEKPSLVLMDITMPNLDGINALKQIRDFDASAKVVMCSAMGQESMVLEAIQSGASDFIVKPFKIDRVLQTVKKMIG